MGIKKGAAPNRNYTQVPNDLIRNRSVSDGAFRLICWITSHADGFDISFSGIRSALGYGRDGLRSIIKNAEQNNYLVRVKSRNDTTGQFDWDYHVFAHQQDAIAFRESIDGLATPGDTTDGSARGGSATGGSDDPHKEYKEEQYQSKKNQPENNSPCSPPGDMNAPEVLVEVEVEILEPEQEEIVATPSVETPKQLPLFGENSNPGEDKNSARRVATKDKVNCDYQVLVDLYNEYKPSLWRKCQLTSDRERTLKGQFKQLGDKLAQVMIDALKWAETDDFWSGRKGKRSGKGKKFDLDSLFYQNRAQKWAGYLEEDSAEEDFKATHRGYSSAHVDQVHRTLANIADL